MLSDAKPQSRWELYRVIADPSRLRLLALSAQEELTVGELAEVLGEGQPTISRHVQALRTAGLLQVRRQGTRSLVRLDGAVRTDAVVQDALRSGDELCRAEGLPDRIRVVIAARETFAHEFFGKARSDAGAAAPPPELLTALSALATLLPDRSCAIDAGTGDGAMLDVLAPCFDRVIAVDRSLAQLAVARARAEARGFRNVEFVHADVDNPLVRTHVPEGADAVFAVRLLHHAPKPGALVKSLSTLLRKGARPGALVALDYAHHEDEAMREQADVWLGFDAHEMLSFAQEAGLVSARVAPAPAPLRGPDAHLPWHILVARARASVATASS